ncbi:MAG: HTH domain-containing protein [Defluviitaleaceae bacterium]|nr:HTH domain-containing protein [Defluviitaleaceae bacterium]
MLGNLKEKAASALGNAAPLDMILNLLRGSSAPLKVGEIAEQTGLDKTIVDKAIKALKKDGRITSPERCKYTVA